MSSEKQPPFRVVPWNVDFLDTLLKDGILKTCRPDDAVVIFPHDRPRRYLTHIFQHDPSIPRPCLLPIMLTINEVMQSCREAIDQASNQATDPTPRRTLRKLDRISLLFKIVKNLDEKENIHGIATTDMSIFFPWGSLLADLFEECFGQGLEPEDIHYAEDEVAPLGADLLKKLGRLFQEYKRILNQQKLSTPGFDASLTADAAKKKVFPLPHSFQGRTIFLAGFSSLHGTEDQLFHRLWDDGAFVWLHADPRLGSAQCPHWACKDMVDWIEKWKAKVKIVGQVSNKTPRVHFFSGYDLHSQIQALVNDLQEEPAFHEKTSLGEVAIVLPHSDALLPVLHSLPDKNCNISLGYPLDRSLLFRFLESILKVRSDTRPDGSILSKSLLELVRHPCLRILTPNTLPSKIFKKFLQRMEILLTKGRTRVQLNAFIDYAIEDFLNKNNKQCQAILAEFHLKNPEQTIHLCVEEMFQATVRAWNLATTLEELAKALSLLCQLLLNWAGKDEDSAEEKSLLKDADPSQDQERQGIWRHYLLEGEALYRLTWNVIPELQDNDMSQEELPWTTLQAILLEIIKTDRVPFKADPLTSLQVLGMLETRLLHFSAVHILDATDDYLPGTPVRNPLLPDSLRSLIGLQDTHHRDLLAAFVFYRLIAGAEDVFLYWQEGIQTSKLFSGKKVRSRLVEELIWKDEQKAGKRFTTGEFPLRAAKPVIFPPTQHQRSIEKTPLIRQAISEELSKPWSDTRLDKYLRCPLRWYYENICKLNPPEQLKEGDDHPRVGTLVHSVLKEWYQQWEGKKLYLPDEATRKEYGKELGDRFLKALEKEQELQETLPPESLAILRVAGPMRLQAFIDKQQEKTTIVSLEEELTCDFQVGLETRKLTGKLDRVDRRDEGIIILDYKTGKNVEKLDDTILDKDAFDAFWTEIFPEQMSVILTQSESVMQPVIDRLRDPDPDQDILPKIAKNLPSLQLPFYMYLYEQAKGERVQNAAFVALGTSQKSQLPQGSEALLFKAERNNEIIQQQFPDLIRLLLLHLEYCPEFRASQVKGDDCKGCLWQESCVHLEMA